MNKKKMSDRQRASDAIWWHYFVTGRCFTIPEVAEESGHPARAVRAGVKALLREGKLQKGDFVANRRGQGVQVYEPIVDGHQDPRDFGHEGADLRWM